MGFFRRKNDRKKLKRDSSYVKKQTLIKPKVEEEKLLPDFLFKVLLVGHNDSGKITHLERFGNSWFEANTKLTIGISFEIKEIKIENLYIRLQIWDLASQDRWKPMVPLYCRGALGAILMFEISSSETLDKLSQWVQIIRENTRNIPIILIGNYDDLNHFRQVSVDQGLDFVKSEGLNGYFECNVLIGENLNKVFESLIRMIIKKYENK
ncbi:MAG: Rab family GTPase [Candidatus Hodarchaeota archaeon]